MVAVAPGWGVVTLGRLSLRESYAVTEDNARTLQVTGQTSVAGLSGDQVERIYHDLMGLQDQFIPVTFQRKGFLSGYYTVQAVKCAHADYTGRLVSWAAKPVVLNWELACQRVGPSSVIDVEARLSGPKTRVNDFGLVGEIVHAPPVGHYGYTTGGTVPPSIVRASADGNITVYRQIPEGAHPRYGCDPALFGGGRVRFLDSFGEERSGIERSTPAAGWSLSNGLVRISPALSGGLFTVESWTGSVWSSRTWDVRRNGVSVAPLTDVDLLHNTHDTVVLRLTTALSPGRVVNDLQLRRGSRMVELYVQSDTSATLAVRLGTAEAGVAGTGIVSSAGEDADGGQYVIGSARTASSDLTNGGLSLANTASLACFLGAVPAATPLDNYTFETNVTGWTATGGTLTQSSTFAKYGTFSARLVTDGTSSTASMATSPLTITPVTAYTVGCWVRCANGRSVTVEVDWRNAGGGVISTASIPMTLPPNTWTPVLRQLASPALAASAVLRVKIAQTIPWSSLSGNLWSSLATWQRPVAFVETIYVDQAAFRPTLSGDTPADMLIQNLGSVSELVTGVRR